MTIVASPDILINAVPPTMSFSDRRRDDGEGKVLSEIVIFWSTVYSHCFRSKLHLALLLCYVAEDSGHGIRS